MRDLASYSVSYPYGATDPPYSASHPHRGNDIAAPNLTPIVVAGTEIGLVGLTGLTTGYHCHIQEWQGNPANCRKPQNAFQPGTVTAATSSSDFGNYITITTADGWNDSYCHLSRINVNVGQVIGGDMPITTDQLYELIRGLTQREPTQDEVTNQKYLDDPGFAIDTFWGNGGKQFYETNKQSAKSVTDPTSAEILTQVKENNSLLCQLLAKLGSIFK